MGSQTVEALQRCEKEPPALLDQGRVTCAPAASGQICTAPSELCPKGFQMIGSLRCMNGTWTEAECVPSPCADPPSGFQFADEALGACRNSQHGAQCQLFCKHGYEVHEPGAKLTKRLHSA